MCSERYMAIDVGGTAIKYILTDRTAKINKINEIKTNRNKNELFNSLDEIIAPHIVDINGIALSFPGKIDADNGIAHTAGALKGISNLPIKSVLEEKYSKPVWIDRGSFGSSGEFSSMLDCLKSPDNEKRFGKIGGHKNMISHYGSDKCIDSYEFFDKYQNGDETAQKALKEYSRVIAAGIINIQSVLDVEKFCIGGGVSAQDALIEEIRKSLQEFISIKSSEAINEPAIEKCRFGNAAGCVGALYNFLIMEKLI